MPVADLGGGEGPRASFLLLVKTNEYPPVQGLDLQLNVNTVCLFSEDWSVVDGHGSESESSDNYTPEHEVRNRPRPVPRPNARVPPVVPKPKDLVPRKKAPAPSPQKLPSRVRKLESEESEEDDDYDDDDDESSRNSVRRAAVTISR